MTYTLTAATVAVRSSDVVLTYTTEGDEPTTGHFQFSTTLIPDTETQQTRQLGWKVLDTQLVAVWWNDRDPFRQRSAGPDVTPTTVGSTHTIVFPLDAIGGIRAGRWRADLDVDGADSGTVEGTL